MHSILLLHGGIKERGTGRRVLVFLQFPQLTVTEIDSGCHVFLVKMFITLRHNECDKSCATHCACSKEMLVQMVMKDVLST